MTRFDELDRERKKEGEERGDEPVTSLTVDPQVTEEGRRKGDEGVSEEVERRGGGERRKKGDELL